METADEMTSPGGAGKKEIRIISRRGILFNAGYEKTLSENSLESFDDFYSLEPQEIVKRMRDERMTARVALKVAGVPRSFYLKKTAYSPLREFIRTILKTTKQFNNAVREFHAYREFLGAGLPTAVPVAAGKRGGPLRVETFCLTADLGDTEKLEDYVPERYTPPLDAGRIREKHALAREVGRLARKMHDAGFNHRDFYLCHVRRFREGGELAVIDLNRAGKFLAGVPQRWVVKDIAALDAGPVPDGIIFSTDRLRCFKAYLGREGKLTPADRKLLVKIIARAESLRTRGEKSRKRDKEFMEKDSRNDR